MPMPAKFADLTKVDRRKQWKGVKEKHSKTIKAAKLDFDQKLGPALDKYQTQVEKIVALSAKGEINTVQVQPVLEAAQGLEKIVESYTGMVKKLEEPAKKELGGVLAAIEGDIDSWKELAVATSGTPAKGTTDVQKAAAHEVMGILDNIRSMCLTIVTRGPRAKAMYEKEKRPLGAKLTSQLVEAARLAGSASHELANAAQQVVAGSNYELFKARAKAAGPLIQKALDAENEFMAKWNINLDEHVIAGRDVDASALKGNYDQIKQDFANAVALLNKLP